ncbi:MAG: hypothetical protein EA364_06570 [Balneolaceae bacterium]|nr:MAG: hypothetical protein EA364_06570 [Balneolaceae bacterium]
MFMSQNLKIGILGPVSRAVVWEKYLRPHPTVSEVVIASDIPALAGVQACILLDEGPDRLATALNLVKLGYHLFIVGRLPMQVAEAEKIFYTAEESGIAVQYSNWAVFSEGTRWMRSQLPRFDLYQSVRELEGMPLESGIEPFMGYILEDVALAQNWSGSNVNRVLANMAVSDAGEPVSIQCYLRFENSSAASVFFIANSRRNLHNRYASGRAGSVFTDVQARKAFYRTSDGGLRADTEYTFDEPEPAHYAVTQFLKTIQLKRDSDFSGYHGLQLARTIRIIREALRR